MDSGTAESLRFGEFELDLRTVRLWRGGVPVKIQPQPLRVLCVLLERPGELVSREELRNRIWGNATFVEFDQGLNYCIRQIRLALRDNAFDPVYIETLPKQGYRFIASVSGNHSNEGASAVFTANPPITEGALRRVSVLVAISVLLAASGAGILYHINARRPASTPAIYTQLTSFTDSAVDPVVSTDGRMLAFYRSTSKFLTADEIYLKMLPDGEPVQITHDPRRKYNLAFTLDGSRIAYSVFENGFSTYTVPIFGGDSQLFLPNAAGLIWLDAHHLMFSEIKTGVHMGVVSTNADRSDHREIYFPEHDRGMAHYSYPSPDRKWALVVEMDPEWKSCRLVPLSGTSMGRPVGPPGACTSASWSPNGEWMYFSVEAEGRRHLWRQRFPDRPPEQITSGSTDEDGVAVAPDGASLVTSIATKQNVIWIHDARGDRALSRDGYASSATPRFSSDGKRIYYLLKHDSPESQSELWRIDLDTGRSEALLPGIGMREFDVSPDEKEIVFSARVAGQPSGLWLAALDRSDRPRRVAGEGESFPNFGPGGVIVFRMTEGNEYYLAKMNRDGSNRQKVFARPILDLFGVSPGGRFVLLGLKIEGSAAPGQGAVYAVPVDGGAVRHVCDDVCAAAWSPDGKFFYLEIAAPSQANPAGKMLAIPIPVGEPLPPLPTSGVVRSERDLGIPGTRLVEQVYIVPGLGSTYAYVKQSTHANLFSIPLQQ